MCSPSPQEAVGRGGLSEVTYGQSLCQESRGKGRTTEWGQGLGQGTGSWRQVTVLLAILSQPLSHALTLCSESA